MNAYAGAYVVPAGGVNAGDRIMYFGLEKNKDNGTNDVGFWFLQGNASCSAPTGHHPWTGKHTVGDVLVVSEFTNGGGVSNITAYRWVGGSNPLTQIGTAGDCKLSLGNDTMCATTNSGAKKFNTAINTPWLTADATLGVGKLGKIVPPDFFEGGIDITKAFNQSGGTPPPSCFNTFIADTRASNVTGSTLFDFTRGQLGQCSSGVSTTAGLSNPPKTGEVAPDATIGNGVASSGTDTATLNITGSTFNGALTWYLCGPDASLTKCDNTKGLLITTTNNVNANGSYISGTANLTQAGHYCWTAHFEPDGPSANAGIQPADDDGTNECFDVAKVTPSIQTCSGTFDASLACTAAGTVNFGSAVTDRASVTGLAKEPGSNGGRTTGANCTVAVPCYQTINASNGAYAGSISFTLKGPAATGCGVTATGTGTNPQSAAIDTAVGNKVYGPVSFTPDHAGLFHWQATLDNSSGSANNILPVSDDANCDDANEAVTVQQIPTDIKSKQSWYPNDTATISSTVTGDNLVAGGTVDFSFYTSSDCTGSAVYSERQTLAGGSHTEEVGTHNFSGSTAKTPGNVTVTPYLENSAYTDASGSSVGGSWKVVYTPTAADTLHLGISSACTTGHTENHTITYSNDPGGH
jgi:hypothetical protein